MTLDTRNVDCGDCKQNAEDEPTDPCDEKEEACITDPDCLAVLLGPDGLSSCQSTPTLACAEAVTSGMSTRSALILVDYFDCICTACSPECDPAGQGGGGAGGAAGAGGAGGSGGGSPNVETCTIEP